MKRAETCANRRFPQSKLGEAIELLDNSPPGSDVLTEDFYKVFWSSLERPTVG